MGRGVAFTIMATGLATRIITMGIVIPIVTIMAYIHTGKLS